MRSGPGKNFDVGISSAKGRSSQGRPTVLLYCCLQMPSIWTGSKIVLFDEELNNHRKFLRNVTNNMDFVK